MWRATTASDTKVCAEERTRRVEMPLSYLAQQFVFTPTMNTSMQLVNQALFESGLHNGRDVIAHTQQVLGECEALFGEQFPTLQNLFSFLYKNVIQNSNAKLILPFT